MNTIWANKKHIWSHVRNPHCPHNTESSLIIFITEDFAPIPVCIYHIVILTHKFAKKRKEDPTGVWGGLFNILENEDFHWALL